MTDQKMKNRMSTHRMSRSPSKSRSRSADKILDSDGSTDGLAIPKFRLSANSPSPCNRRRASAVQFSSESSSSGGNRLNHARSRSLRAKRHSTYLPHSLSGSQLDKKASDSARSSVSHSLSVPSGEEGEFHLVRNFSVTSKGVINRGDSFRCKSRSTSLSSTPTSPGSEKENAFPVFSPDVTEPSPVPPSPCAMAIAESKEVPKYTVWILGMNGVGKSAIRNQFMTSEYICQYDTWKDESVNKSVVVALDGEETELEIIEYTSVEEKLRQKENLPNAYIIVYSVTNRRSYLHARQIISKVEGTFDGKAAILVGNKTDLARLRTVTTVEGRSLAKERGCKFVETSVAINHQLDELLVGIITQIRMKAKIAEKQRKRNSQTSSRSKATCIIKRIWRRTCITSKSCDNLHAL